MDSTAVTRSLPNNLEAEQSVIGAMLFEESVIDEGLENLEESDFYYPQYGIIFSAIRELRTKGETVNFITVSNQLEKNNAAPDIKDVNHLKYLADSVYIPEDIGSFAKVVKEKSLLRQIISKNKEIQEICFNENNTVEEILDLTEKSFLSLLQRRGVKDATPIYEIVNNAMDKIYDAFENKSGLTGLSTGFYDLDSITSGLQNSDMILIAARPSMGKTAFALNIANHVAIRQMESLVVFSLEMSQESLVNRLFSIDAGIDAKSLATGQLEEHEWRQLKESADSIAKSRLIIDESPSITISEIRSKCRKYKQQSDIKLVIIDYLQLIGSTGKQESKQQEVSNISRSLKALARELNVPVIVLSQLNRGPELREDKRPMLSDLRDSGAIEQDADIVMLLYRDEYYNKDQSKEKGISEVIIAKHRNGPTGTIKLKWMDKFTKFQNLENPRNQLTKFD